MGRDEESGCGVSTAVGQGLWAPHVGYAAELQIWVKQPAKAKSPPQGAADLGTRRRTARRHFDLLVWEPPPRRESEASLSQCNN